MYSKIIDISWPISPDMTAYKDRSIVTFTQTKTYEKDHAREATVLLGTHSGTHVDAPAHFLEHGQSLDQIDLNCLIGSCKVLDLTYVQEKITEQDLRAFNITQDDRILLKTKNSFLDSNARFDGLFVYLEKSGAEYLVSKNIRSIGIDYLGIERNQADHATHELLLHNNISIIEGLRLGHVEPDEYTLCCLPLLLSGLEAAPARAVLLK